MKKILILLLLISTFALKMKAQWDIILEPIDVSEPTAYDMNQGNYAPSQLRVNDYEFEIEKRLKRHVIVFMYGTAGKLDHVNLNSIARNDLGAVYTGETSPIDRNGHETHVAGCIAGLSENFDLGTAQILAKNKYIEIVPVKVLNDAGQGSFANVNLALKHYIEVAKEYQKDGYFVIHQMSLGGNTDYDPLLKNIEKASKMGQLFTIAAGNTGQSPVQSPGRARGANAIAATDQQNKRAYFSSTGKQIFVGVPGVQIFSTKSGGGYVKMSGTSMASPTFCGIASIIAAINKTATANQILQGIAANCTDIAPSGRDEKTGYGIPIFGDWIFDDFEKKYKDEPIKWLDNNVPDNPDEPDKYRELRTLSFDYENYKIKWKRLSGKDLKNLEVSFRITVKTKLYDAVIYNRVKKEIKWFFTNRALVVSDHHGFADATKWTAFFAELLINRHSKLNVKIQFITGESEARSVYIEGSKFHKKINSKKLKRLRYGDPYLFSLK